MTTVTASQAKQKPCKGQCLKCTNESKASPDAIATRAYELYLFRHATGFSGDQLSDWVQAEREMNAHKRSELLMKGDQK